MKLGLLSAILADRDFAEVAEIAGGIGYECVEVACWPKGRAERRYAGVSHIDVGKLDEKKKREILGLAADNGISISALSYYPNPMDPDKKRRAAHIAHLTRLFEAAAYLGVGTVGTFVGRDPAKSTEDNLKLFADIWPGIVASAKKNRVRIAIENCPMLFTADEWPGGQNLAISPAIWRRMYEIIPDANFGLNFDPSHFVWQEMDYIAPLYEFRERIFHIHFKDIKLCPERRNGVGVLGLPLEYMAPKLPGLGDVDWSAFVSALYDIGYDGAACVEVEDRAFESGPGRVGAALRLSHDYMRQWVR